MPILPIIDALILLGWSSVFAAFLLKAIYVTTSFRPEPFGMHPSDFLFVASVCLLFALTLAARTWVKEHEPALLAGRFAQDAACGARQLVLADPALDDAAQRQLDIDELRGRRTRLPPIARDDHDRR